MALNITKGENIKVNSLIVLLYGEPSTGKTSTALTSSKPILFDFDGGAQRSAFKTGKDIVRIKSWKEVVDIMPTLEKDLEPYDTIVIDTVETCLDFIRIYIENQDYKLKTNALRMYGKLKDEFYSFLNRITKINKHIIFIAHASTEEKNGSIVTIPKITGGSKDIVRQKADFIGYMFIHNNQRTLNFNPTDYYEGKNSANFPVLTLPDYTIESDYFQEVLNKMKDALQSSLSEDDEMNKEIQEFKEQLYELNEPEEFNRHLQYVAERKGLLKKQAWSILKNRAFAKDCVFDEQNKTFVKAKTETRQVETQAPVKVVEVRKEEPKEQLFEPKKNDFNFDD